MKFILLICLSTFSADGGVSAASAEFNTQQACEVAAKAVQEEFKGFFLASQPPKAICVPKGAEPVTQ